MTGCNPLLTFESYWSLQRFGRVATRPAPFTDFARSWLFTGIQSIEIFINNHGSAFKNTFSFNLLNKWRLKWPLHIANNTCQIRRHCTCNYICIVSIDYSESDYAGVSPDFAPRYAMILSSKHTWNRSNRIFPLASIKYFTRQPWISSRADLWRIACQNIKGRWKSHWYLSGMVARCKAWASFFGSYPLFDHDCKINKLIFPIRNN